MAWINIAHLVDSTLVNWEEEYFLCPICGEPIYKADWQEEDYFNGHFYTGTIYCPVCEEPLS